MRTADLELDLDVFAGPFDLLLAIVLREEISLLEVPLGEVVVAYIERLEETGELELGVGDYRRHGVDADRSGCPLDHTQGHLDSPRLALWVAAPWRRLRAT